VLHAIEADRELWEEAGDVPELLRRITAADSPAQLVAAFA
jgi:hypothetical protein